MTTKRKNSKKASKTKRDVAEARSGRRAASWRMETRLAVPAGEPNLEALGSVTREWLVPLLVEEFLREQGVELRARSNADPGKNPIPNT